MNSWILEDKFDSTLYHCFCKCGHNFQDRCDSFEETIDIVCPKCDNDYFIDTQEFESGKKTKIWKHFFWKTSVTSDKQKYSITSHFNIPRFSKDGIMTIEKQDLTQISISKIKLPENKQDNYRINHIFKLVPKYKLYLDSTVKILSVVLCKGLKERLLNEIINNKIDAIKWIDEKNIYIHDLSIEHKLKFFNFFLQNQHLKEIEFFFYWKMSPAMLEVSKKYPSQKAMLNYIANHKKQKSVKKVLYQLYAEAISEKEYYPYYDFVFCRCFEDINFLTALLSIKNYVKKQLVSENTIDITIVFFNFLKKYYSEKQISKLFLENTNFSFRYKNLWKDTIMMVNNEENLAYMKQHFQKVKLTVPNLHDELVNIFNHKKYEEEEKIVFEYKKYQLKAQTIVDNLEFCLPKNLSQLHLWARELHNCMFSYANKIQEKRSVIYGIFKNKKLTYAIELKDMEIVQRYGAYNRQIEESEDIENITTWFSEMKNL